MNEMNQQQQMMNQQPTMMSAPPPQLMNPQQTQPPQMLMNPPQPQPMMNRSYGMWPPAPQPRDLQMKKFQNPNPNSMNNQGGSGYASRSKPPAKHLLGPRNNWKGKKVNKPDKRKDLGRRVDNSLSMGGSNSSGVGVAGAVGVGGGYQPPNLKDLQHQNRMKARKFFPKKYYNNNNNYYKNSYNMGKFAPRNTTSYIIRAKKSGGIAELVSPCPVTPSVLPTPIFSPSREVLVDMAKEEWGVDGYGSMKGLIRLRSPGHEGVEGHEEDDEEEGGSSESDVEEHLEVERRLDHDLSRFEMIYPNCATASGVEYNNVLENRVDDQDTHIAQLEDENLILKERLFLMERELGDLRRRLQCLERQSQVQIFNEEVVENLSENENESESRGGAHSVEDNNEEMAEDNVEADLDAKGKDESVHDGNNKACKNEEITVEIRVPEESKYEVKVNDVQKNVYGNDDLQVNIVKDGNDSAEAPKITPAGDVCMVEDGQTGEGFIEEKQSKQEAARSEGLEESIDE